MNRFRRTMFGLIAAIAFGTLLGLSDAQERLTPKTPPEKVGPARVNTPSASGPWTPLQVKLDANSPTYTYLHPRHFQPPKDGDYTAAVKAVTNFTFKIEVSAVVIRPGAKLEKTAVRVSTKTEKGILLATFPAKKGTQYDITLSTTKPIPKGAKVDTAFIMLSGDGRKARPIAAARPIEDLLPPGAPKDASIPIVVRLMERHLANVKDKNELDRAFDNILKRNPRMTRDRMETFVKNYNAIPEKVRRDHFVDPTPGLPAKAALTKEHVKTAFTAAHPDLAKAVSHKRIIVTPEAKKLLKERPILNAKVEQFEKASIGQFIKLSVAPQVDRLDPAPPPNGYKAGDKLTLTGKNFSTEAIKNQIWLMKPSTGPDGGITKRYLTPDSATATQLKFTLPTPPAALYKGTYSLSVQTPSGVSIKDLPLPVQEALPPTAAKPVIKEFSPMNMEPGTTINITTWPDKPLMKKNPVVYMLATGPDPVKGEFIVLNGKSVSDTKCTVDLPTDMTPGIYDISVEGGDGAWSIMSDALAYDIKPGRYRILFEKMECVHPCHVYKNIGVGSIDFDWDANLLTVWSTDVDDVRWPKTSSKYDDIGGGHPPVSYKGTEGNVFVDIPGNVEGFQSVRYGLVLTTQLYDWEGDADAKELASDIKTYGDMAGGIVSMVYAPVGGVITLIADKLAQFIPIVAQLFGFTESVAFPTYSGVKWLMNLGDPLSYPAPAAVGPDKKSWTAADLQKIPPGKWLPGPPGTPGYTMKFGWGSWDDWCHQYQGKGAGTYVGDPWGDWKVTWRIQRAAAGGNVNAP